MGAAGVEGVGGWVWWRRNIYFFKIIIFICYYVFNCIKYDLFLLLKSYTSSFAVFSYFFCFNILFYVFKEKDKSSFNGQNGGKDESCHIIKRLCMNCAGKKVEIEMLYFEKK